MNNKNEVYNSTRAKEILSFLLKNVIDDFEIVSKEDSKNIYFRVFMSKNDYNFFSKNKSLEVSLKAIAMAYGAKINKKINVNFVVKDNKLSKS